MYRYLQPKELEQVQSVLYACLRCKIKYVHVSPYKNKKMRFLKSLEFKITGSHSH